MWNRAKAKVAPRRVPLRVNAPGAQEVRVTGDFSSRNGLRKVL